MISQTGGRDTAGMGGRGGYKRLYKGHDIKQVSDQLKDDVPDEIKEKAREMARQELACRLEELNMSEADACLIKQANVIKLVEKIGEKSGTQTSKQQGLSNDDTMHPYLYTSGKSEKVEGVTDTAKLKGTVSPERGKEKP